MGAWWSNDSTFFASGGVMQNSTSRELYAYWDRVRNGRIAPYRFEIEPQEIASLLPETFIAECDTRQGVRFRLAGTKICEQFGRELRGSDVMALWTGEDREAVASLIRDILKGGAVGHGRFRALTVTGRQADFELLLLPLIHNGTAVNRLLGMVSAVDEPYWLGAEPLERQEIVTLHRHWPGEAPALEAKGGAEIVRLARRPFRVIEGGGRTRFVP
jgi:hypothetical protein